ncbi:MAG: thrombospondin type 3 repeat-containing protein [Verrucomicrobiota bacterium]
MRQRQHDFLEAWARDWTGQDLKFLFSQSPLGNLHTHASNGYNFSLNDRDTHGWPVARRNEAWAIVRKSFMFQLAGDQHLATVSHHGVDRPRDAGFAYTVPALANFFARCWDPVHNAAGTTSVISPYQGDFFLNGAGTLPDGFTPNLNSAFPHHFAVLAAANPAGYYNQTLGIDPAALHDQAAGYGIVRIDKTTRKITFEAWPRYADPDFIGDPVYAHLAPQYADWPITICQTDNDGRSPTGHLEVVNTQWRKSPVLKVFDETTGELVYALRIRGNLFRPPVYDMGTTYRVEISYGDDPVSEILTNRTATTMGTPRIHRFSALQPSIIAGDRATLQWDVESPVTLNIDQGVGDVMAETVHGIGYLNVAPSNDTTYTLTLNGGLTSNTTIRVFPSRTNWLALHFSPAELALPGVSGPDADPDGDGFSNDVEYQFQTDPRDPASLPHPRGRIHREAGTLIVRFTSPFPLEAAFCTLAVQTSSNLIDWLDLPANSFHETERVHAPAEGTSRITIQLDPPPEEETRLYYRAFWRFDP